MLQLVRLIALGLGAIATYRGVENLFKKKIFISFAYEDIRFRDLFVGQMRNQKTPFDFIDMSVSEPWKSSWKTECRERIKDCHGFVALVSKNTAQADGACWEIKCAIEEKIPLLAIYVSDKDRSRLMPAVLKGKKIQKWTWFVVQKFLSDLK